MTHPQAGGSFGLRQSSGDTLLDPVGDAGPRRSPSPRQWRRLFEWSGTSAPVGALLVSGIALGPAGISLLSADALSALAPAVPVALAALGVLVGLSVGLGRRREGVVAGAGVDAVVTVPIVSIGLGALAWAGLPVLAEPYRMLIAGAGICAASSLTLPTGNPLEPRTTAARLVEVGVLTPILLGALMLAWMRTAMPVSMLLAIAAASVLVCAVATAIWLLLTVASAETEKGVLTVGALLLIGGVSDALATSALFAGVVAGFFWRSVGGRPLEAIGRDVLFLQHPLLVIVLLTAGAGASLTRASLAFGSAYVALRVLSRLAAGLLAQRTSGRALPAELGLHLLPPGVFGVAFALNVASVMGGDAAVLLGAVVVGTIGADLVAFCLPPRGASA